MVTPLASNSALGGISAAEFLALSTPKEKKTYLEAMNEEVLVVDLAHQWFLDPSTYSAFIEVLPLLKPTQFQELSSQLICPIKFSNCFKWVYENFSNSKIRYKKAEFLFKLVKPSLLSNWKTANRIGPHFISFLIARLPESEKIPYLISLLTRYPHNLHFVFDSLALAFNWSPRVVHQCHLARLVISVFSALELKNALDYFSHKHPHLLFLFHVNLPHGTLKSLYDASIHSPITKAYSRTLLTNYVEFKKLLDNASENGLFPLFVNSLRIKFAFERNDENYLYLSQFPFILGESAYSPDPEGFDNFALDYRSGIQRIPPVLIGIGAQDPNLTRWFIHCSRVFTPDQIRCLIWALPFYHIKYSLNTLLDHLQGDSLTAALKALPPLIRNTKLDQKMREVATVIFTGNRVLSTLSSDAKQLPVATHWEATLMRLLAHPQSLPFWKAAEDYHPLCSHASSLKSLLKSFKEKREELQSLTEKEIDVEPTLKMAPPYYLTSDLICKLGNVELEKVGIRKQSDLDALGVTLQAINDFNTLEHDLLDDLPLCAVCDWEKRKWQNHPLLLTQFFQHYNRTPPDALQNPFAPLQRYLRQNNLESSWEKMRQKQIYSIGQILENCLIESPEELFTLENLAAKFS